MTIPNPPVATTRPAAPVARAATVPAGRRPPPASAPEPPAIEVKDLVKRFGHTLALDGLSLKVPRHGVTGFVGPNGAGKTTTIRILLGLVRPASGTASVLGHAATNPSQYLSRVGALIEGPAFYPPLSGRKNLRVLAALGKQSAERVEEVLGFVGLADRGDDAFKTYSLGMKQRLGIAAALLPDPDLLILDEPTNGLDPAGIREMRDLLRRLADAGKTVFVSSHLMAEMQKLCDRLVVIRGGRLVYQGPVSSLVANQGILMRTATAAQQPRLIEVCRAAGHQAEVQGDHVLVHAPVARAGFLNARAVQAGIEVTELRPQSADLEQVVLEMTGKGGL